MIGHYIAVTMFEHKIDCFCPGGDHTDFLTINEGDILEVTAERKFTVTNGWYFLVRFNEHCIFYMSLEDLEQYFIKEQLLSMLDMDLTINHLQYKINQALDTGDKTSFMSFTEKLKEASDFKMKLEQYVSSLAV